jgi:mRNA interferase RelE/StbE
VRLAAAPPATACSWTTSAENREVRYRLAISEKAREQLRRLPRHARRNIGQRMEGMRNDLHGDVTKLKDKGNRYRLRVGNYRVLFVLAGDVIQVYSVKDRKEAYE